MFKAAPSSYEALPRTPHGRRLNWLVAIVMFAVLALYYFSLAHQTSPTLAGEGHQNELVMVAAAHEATVGPLSSAAL